MASVLDIYNQAIGACGVRSVINDPAENSPEAITCRRYYEQALTSTLQIGWWNFAQRTEYLTLYAAGRGTPESASTNTAWLRTDPPPPWSYAYRMPADSIQMRAAVFEVSTNTFSPPQKFKSMTMYDATNGTYIPVVVTNITKAIGIYTANVRDPNLFDGQFVDALITRLAADMAMELTGDIKVWQKCEKVWKDLQTQALASDANEGLGYVTHIPATLAVRGYNESGDPSLYIPAGELT